MLWLTYLQCVILMKSTKLRKIVCANKVLRLLLHLRFFFLCFFSNLLYSLALIPQTMKKIEQMCVYAVYFIMCVYLSNTLAFIRISYRIKAKSLLALYLINSINTWSRTQQMLLKFGNIYIHCHSLTKENHKRKATQAGTTTRKMPIE